MSSTQSEQIRNEAEAEGANAQGHVSAALRESDRRGQEDDSTHGSGGNGYDAEAAALTPIEIEDAGEFDYEEDVPGYEPAASDCLNRAMRIARSLNHTSLSADHLMLALTMDQNARKLLERAGNISVLREAAMLQLGKMNWKFARPMGRERNVPMQTSDLEDIHKTARHAAAERGQRVAISDLINAFPHEEGGIAYDDRDAFDVPAVVERIESGLAPRVTEVMAQFQGDLREALQRELTNVIRDVAEPQMRAAVQRQVTALEDINRQFRGLLEGQLTGAMREFKEKLMAELEAAEPREEEPEQAQNAAPQPMAGTAPTAVTTAFPPRESQPAQRRYWNWMALI